MHETIIWTPVGERLPDDDTSVLICTPNAECEPVWIGYHDGDGCWRDAEGELVQVTHWAEMPKGVQA